MTTLLIYNILYFALFGISELLFYRANKKVEYTRKLVHISTGLIALSFPVFIEAFWQMILLCGSFLLLMTVCEKMNWLKSITSVKRKSYGSWLFALIVLVCFWVQQQFNSTLYYYLPILILSICDPLAALIGKKLNYKPLTVFGQTKTVGGSLAFFVSSLLILIGFYFSHKEVLLYLPLFAISITLAEFFSTKGWDNFTIPLGAIANIFILTHIIN